MIFEMPPNSTGNTPTPAYRNASFLADNRVVFNIKGNDYRLVVAVHYNRGLMFIRFVGTHQRYARIDASKI